MTLGPELLTDDSEILNCNNYLYLAVLIDNMPVVVRIEKDYDFDHLKTLPVSLCNFRDSYAYTNVYVKEMVSLKEIVSFK